MPRKWKSVLFLAETTTRELQIMEIESPLQMANGQLNHATNNGLKGGQISFVDVILCRSVGVWRGLWRWTRSHKYWVICFSVSAAFPISMIQTSLGLLDYDMRLPDNLMMVGLRREDGGKAGGTVITAALVSFLYSVSLLALILARHTRGRLR